MTLQEFKDKAQKTSYDDRNGWGIGTWGDTYTLGESTFYEHSQQHRHSGVTKIASVCYKLNGVYYNTKKEFLTQLEKL